MTVTDDELCRSMTRYVTRVLGKGHAVPDPTLEGTAL